MPTWSVPSREALGDMESHFIGLANNRKGFRKMHHFERIDNHAVMGPEQHALLNAIFQGSRRPPEGVFLRTLGTLLLREMISLLSRKSGEESTSKGYTSFLSVCAEISRTWHTPINRDIIARRVGLHSQHVSRLFRKYANTTFNAYLSECRLKHAAEMLEQDGHTIADVAAACGFTSDSYFITSFSKHFGHTPGRHRDRATRDGQASGAS